MESGRRRTQGALSVIPHSLFSWMSAPFIVQAEGGGGVISPVALPELRGGREGGR